jgi:hypothetical protein
MTALTIEQFEKYQTPCAESNYYPRPSVKFNSAAKILKRIDADIVLKRNSARIQLRELSAFKSSLGTVSNAGKRMHCNSSKVVKIYPTQGAGFSDFWLGETKLSDYGALVDDYDVAAVEEIQMQSASKYGW